MTTQLKQGSYTIERTDEYEIYKLGDKFYKFNFKTWSVSEIKREAFDE